MNGITMLLLGGPQNQDAGTVRELATAALRRGMEVEIFLMYEGVLNASDKRFLELADSGAKITVCGHNADEFHAERTDKFTYASQYEHAKMLSGADKYLAFT